MILHSTSRQSPNVSFAEGILNGLAPDGGLYMPDSYPRLPNALFRNIHEMHLNEIAYVISNTLFGDILGSDSVKRMVDGALNFNIPLVELDSTTGVLELFHGPTMSFKDVGARFMASLMQLLYGGANLAGRDILVATSGDSGGAIANAFSSMPNTRVIVLFPKDELSRGQILQFATNPKVMAVEVDGTFDSCQALVKEALMASHNHSGGRVLTSGNSINAARALPSIIYFFWAYAQALSSGGLPDNVVISVPCGNLGSICAALMAKRMGLPVKRFVAANNANDAFVEYLKTGGFSPRERLLTLARAMDVGNPSNMARIIDLYGGNLNELRRDVEGYAYSDNEIAETMMNVYNDFGYVIDPQGATALRALQRHLRNGEYGVALATAHPIKFSETIKSVTGVEPSVPPEFGRLQTRAIRTYRIPPTLWALNRILKSTI